MPHMNLTTVIQLFLYYFCSHVTSHMCVSVAVWALYKSDLSPSLYLFLSLFIVHLWHFVRCLWHQSQLEDIQYMSLCLCSHSALGNNVHSDSDQHYKVKDY